MGIEHSTDSMLAVVFLSNVLLSQIPETGSSMSWADANALFSQNEMNRDYARLSTSLDAADQSAGFRPADQLTRGVPFSKVPDLSFNAFANGKMDGSISSYVRQLTPYLSASHYINKIRSPRDDQFIYPQANQARVPPQGAVSMEEINQVFSRNPERPTASPDLEQQMGSAGMMNFGINSQTAFPFSAPQAVDSFQNGVNPYAFAAPQ
eukprot:c11074_g1_i1.p1 GENE.c11074_g1_i1~~c11074_g1_i1.p1  ORF type:complete len:208 (+),score=34.66 c11074_g1_i1:1-624(+)